MSVRLDALDRKIDGKLNRLEQSLEGRIDCLPDSVVRADQAARSAARHTGQWVRRVRVPTCVVWMGARAMRVECGTWTARE